MFLSNTKNYLKVYKVNIFVKKFLNYNVLISGEYPYFQILTKYLEDLCTVAYLVLLKKYSTSHALVHLPGKLRALL